MTTVLTAASGIVASGTKMPISDAGIAAVLGYAVVFAGLLILLAVMSVSGKIMSAKDKRKKAAKAAPAAVSPAAPLLPVVTAPGSAGEIKLYDTPEKDAAMLMAIIADMLGKPINELRFKSIREVK